MPASGFASHFGAAVDDGLGVADELLFGVLVAFGDDLAVLLGVGASSGRAFASFGVADEEPLDVAVADDVGLGDPEVGDPDELAAGALLAAVPPVQVTGCGGISSPRMLSTAALPSDTMSVWLLFGMST